MAGNWTKLTVTGHVRDLDGICAVMSMLDNGLMIEDYSDFSLNGMYGELVDESILNADRETVRVSIFVPEEKNFAEYKVYLEARLAALGINHEISIEGMNEEDWSESWKQYYKPIPLGRVTVVPAWEKYEAKEGEILVRMDPGMAFGTGTHETTRLCAELLEENITAGDYMLDVGSGSGILAICASKLGAAKCAACDIDPIAVRTEKENADRNNCPNIDCYVSDLLSDVKTIDGKAFDIVTANIVADIIIRLAPDVGAFIRPDGLFIASGIIDEREADVDAALTKYGLQKLAAKHEKGWCAVLFKKS